MFLTKKSILKIWLLTGLYGILTIACLAAFITTEIYVGTYFLAILAAICFVLGLFSYMVGRYAEGKGKLLDKGNKLVNRELKPAEFIRLYENVRDCPDNVVAKPDFDVLALLLVAYDSLGATEREFEIIEQLKSIATKKKMNRVKLVESALLYETGKIDEAEELYKEVLNSKIDFMATAILDVVTKSDRARALGDFTLAEMYYKQKLISTFPKPAPLDLIESHFILADIYFKTDRKEEAKTYLEYCAQNGGETKIRLDAIERLKEFE